MNAIVTYLLEQTPVYSLWQAPFAAEKLAPLLAHNDLRRVRRVLDVGCGPGMNTHLFKQQDYLGVDINPGYIESARRKHGRAFVVADVTTYEDASIGKFDFILVNSFLHHVDDEDAKRVLASLGKWATNDGYVHVIELVRPVGRSVARLLACWDRGEYTRPWSAWQSMLESHLDIAVLEPYEMKLGGTTLWNMLYCKGRPKK
jgi:SAM-dependent methyltransferase